MKNIFNTSNLCPSGKKVWTGPISMSLQISVRGASVETLFSIFAEDVEAFLCGDDSIEYSAMPPVSEDAHLTHNMKIENGKLKFWSIYYECDHGEVTSTMCLSLDSPGMSYFFEKLMHEVELRGITPMKIKGRTIK